MIRTILSILLPLALITGCATAKTEAEQQASASAAMNTALKLDGLDLYGSDQVTLAQVYAKHGPLIQRYADAYLNQRKPEMEAARQEFEQAMAKMGSFAYVGLSLVSYFPPKPGRYMTIDLVDEVDRIRRMGFTPRPTYSYPDPGKLLRKWSEYEAIAFKLMAAGEIQFPVECPVFHCLAGFTHPELVKYGELFNREVPKHQAMLYRILNGEKDDQKRATAAFLLAHTRDLNKLVSELSKRIADESPLVRNNVMRVMAFIPLKYETAELPINEIIKAADFPTATDRNKAYSILASLSKRDDYKRPIIAQLGPQLIRSLKLLQPNIHEPAYYVLKNVSGQNFGERDYASWENWLKQNCPECQTYR